MPLKIKFLTFTTVSNTAGLMNVNQQFIPVFSDSYTENSDFHARFSININIQLTLISLLIEEVVTWSESNQTADC